MNKRGDENRSVRNTKRRLREGLLQLMVDKPINKISVKELTDLVDVNRGTFYFHYSDTGNMLEKIKLDFFNGFDEVLNRVQPDAPNEAYPYLTEIFRFLGDNRDICIIMLGPNGDMAFVNRLKQLVDERCAEFWKITMPNEDAAQLSMLNAFIINGCIGIIEKWLSGDWEKTPDETADFAAKTIVACVEVFEKP